MPALPAPNTVFSTTARLSCVPGYLATCRVPVTAITGVSVTVRRCPFAAAYALSRRGVVLRLRGAKRPLFVSPKELDAFVRELSRRNPAIEISD